MSRDRYALQLKKALDLPYARAKRISDAAKVTRPRFQTELGAIVTSCELDPALLGPTARGEQGPPPLILRGPGPRRMDLVDALLPDEIPSSIWVGCIAEFAHDLDRLDGIVQEVEEATGDEGSDELLLAALKGATWLSSAHRRWLSTIREILILPAGSWTDWWWELDPRRDLLGAARLMRSYDLRLRPVLGERLTLRA